MEKKLTVQRQRKLKKEFPDGEAVGRAFVKFYLDKKRKEKDPEFEPVLTSEEMDFLKSTLYAPIDQELFRPYNILETVLQQFAYWIDHSEHIYYHGLFRDLSVIQTPDYEIQIYHLLKQVSTDEKFLEEKRARCIHTLIPIVEILIPNWKGMIAYPLKELYNYSFRLEKIQEIMNFDFSPLLPDLKHHEIELRELQRIAKVFQSNLVNYINNDNFEVDSKVLKKLDEFVLIDINSIKLNDEEKKDNTQKAVQIVDLARGGTE